MIVIYESTEKLFKSLGLGILKDFKSDPLITEELNGIYTLEFDYSINGNLNEYLEEGNIIKANNQAFRIWNIKKSIDTIKVLAKHIIFDLSKNFLEDVAPTELNSQNALRWILDRAQYETGFSVQGDCHLIKSARYVEKNIIDSIYNEDNAILKRFGGEIEVDNYNIFIHNKRGTDKGFSIRYRKNLSGIDFNLDFTTVATRICPQGKDNLHLDNKYVDSPKINNYFMPFYKKVEFDIGVDEETTEEQAKEKLLEVTNELFDNKIDEPQISIKIDFVELSKCEEYSKYSNLESCELGDVVSAIIPTLNLNLKTRVVKTIYNCLLERYITLELGSTVPNFVSESNKSNANINKELKKVDSNSILQQAREDATKIINHPFNGNLYIDENSGVLYLLDTNDPLTASSVWKWSLGGLGYSSTGINGNFETAITQDGQIVANFITTGIIQADRIEGYESLIISVTNNYVELSEKFNDYTPRSKTVEIENSVTQLQTDTYTKTEINKKLTDGSVTKVSTTSSTFDEDGAVYDKTGSKCKIRVGYENDNEGVLVKDKQTNSEKLFAGYDDEIKETIVRTENLMVRKYLVASNVRIEDYAPEGCKGVGFYL